MKSRMSEMVQRGKIFGENGQFKPDIGRAAPETGTLVKVVIGLDRLQ